MKRIAVVLSVVAIAVAVIGCEGLLPEIVTPVEQVQNFIDAANADPQNPAELKNYFDSSAADYGSMQLESYW